MTIKKHVCDPERHGTQDNGQPLLPELASCGRCGRCWCDRCCPTPSALCPFCNGDESRGKANQIGSKQATEIQQTLQNQRNIANHTVTPARNVNRRRVSTIMFKTIVTASELVELVRRIHRNEHDFYDGDLRQRIYRKKLYRLIDLPLANIDLTEWELDEERIIELMEQMKSNPFYPPIIYHRKAQSMVDGIHRANAASRLGYETIVAYV